MVHFLPTVTLGWGIEITWFGMMCAVFANHHAATLLRTCPL
jgi:hypothetical protein